MRLRNLKVRIDQIEALEKRWLSLGVHPRVAYEYAYIGKVPTFNIEKLANLSSKGKLEQKNFRG